MERNYLDEGTDFYNKKKYKKAIESFKKAISLNPNLIEAWSNLGTTYMSKKDNKNAIKCYNKAIEINPKDVYSWEKLAMLYMSVHNFDKALEYYQNVTELDSKNFDAWKNSGLIFGDKEQFKEARYCLKKAAELEPNNIELQEFLASLPISNDETENENDEDKEIIMAMLALNKKKDVSFKKIGVDLRKDWSDFPKIDDISIDKNVTIIYLENEVLISLMYIDIPIPWNDLEGPCATAYLWPEATKKMRNHKSHLIISAMGIADNFSIVEKSILITKVITTIVKNSDATGIYWGSGTVVNSPERFTEVSKDCFKEGLFPVGLWIEYRIQKNENGTYNIITTGMNTFGHKEIEVQNTNKNPFEHLGNLYDLTQYLFENGPVIKDGDTFGGTAEEKNKIRFGVSLWKRPEVMILTF